MCILLLKLKGEKMKKLFVVLFTMIFCVASSAAEKKKYDVIISGAGAIEQSFLDFARVMDTAGITFVPERKIGGAGMIGVMHFLNSKNKDQLIWVGASLSVGNSTLKKNPEYSMDDYKPVMLAQTAPLLFTKSPKSKSKINSFADLYKPGCTERLIVSVGSMHGEVAGRILEKTSTCDIKVVKYKGDAGALPDISNGTVDIGLLPLLTAQSIVDQGGKILASTADPEDKDWKDYVYFDSRVKGAVVYGLYGLWASKNMDEKTYRTLVKQIQTTWGNKKIRNSKIKNVKKGFAVMDLYGDEYKALLVKHLTNLRRLSTDLKFQR